ncbi:MAG: OmpA family protein [Halocynthiibacter sp.]
MIRAKLPLLLVTASALTLSACTDPDYQTGNQNRTRDGALIGGALGALLGSTSGAGSNRVRNAVIGGAIGAGVGAAIGNELDKQAAELRRDLGNDRVQITNTGSELIVTMPQDILFAVDSSTVRPDLQGDLRVLARNLQDYPDTTVDVIGHTDNTGEAGYNQSLSARRASAVASVLLGAGVSGSRVRSYGRGEDEPVASNLTPEGRSQNRRVVIVIRPTT